MIDFILADRFAPFIEDAVIRFNYLYPEVNIAQEGNKIRLSGDVAKIHKSEFFHLLYKQKIYQETLSIRKDIYKMISDD